jgi:adenylate cyclase
MEHVAPLAYLDAEINGQPHQFPLPDDRICRIGRSDKNTIVLEDDLASRNHAMLQRSETGQFYLTDLGSSNGTLVNGARICVPTILHSGDHVTIGSHEFTFHQPQPAAPPAPTPEAEPDELKSTSIFFAQKLISVLVVDIRDFTGLARRIDAAKLSQISGTFFREGGKALQERGAWAQKYIGDAIMAVWLHKKREPELRELLSIFEGLSKLVAVAGTLQAHLGLDAPIRIGSGVNTGWASVGNVGSIASSDYTALGDVVNKAFRLESATKEVPCDLLLGQGTYDFLAKAAGLEGLFQPNTVKLKGYDEPATAYGTHFPSLQALLEGLQRMQAIAG